MADNGYNIGNTGLGSIPPYPGMLGPGGGQPSSDPTQLLQQILGVLQTIQQRLAPPQFQEAVFWDGTSENCAPGKFQIVNASQYPGGYNSILVCLTAGSCSIYNGGPTGPLLIPNASASPNPALVPMPIIVSAAQITLVVNNGANAKGIIYFQSY